MADSDSLQKFVFENAPIRGEIVRLDAAFRAVLARRRYPAPLRALLGEFLAAAALLASTLKFEGRLILQLEGQGPLKLLMAECSSERTLRGLAQWEGRIAPRSLGELAGEGRLAITIEPRKGKERYQGIVELGGASVAQAIEHYFNNSEQLDTRLWLATGEERAAGMLLQRLPGELPDTDMWMRAVKLGETVTESELLDLPVRKLLHRLYHEEDIRLFSGSPVSFRCSCSRARVEGVLRMLGRDEVRSILAEQGSVDVNCEFCGARYRYDAVDAEQLFASEVMTSPPPIRH